MRSSRTTSCRSERRHHGRPHPSFVRIVPVRRLGIRLADFSCWFQSARRGRGTDRRKGGRAADPRSDVQGVQAGEAPPAMEARPRKIKAADAFVFVTGEYNWGMQPGLKNLTDIPGAMVLAAGRDRELFARPHRRRPSKLTWHGILSEMGMAVVSSTLTVGPISEALEHRRQADGRSRKAPRERLPPLRRRPRVVDRSREDATGAQGSASIDWSSR